MHKGMLLTALLMGLLLLSGCEFEVPAAAPTVAVAEPEAVPAAPPPEPMSEATPAPTAELETAQTGPPAVLVTGAVVNVRAGPSTDHDVVTTVVQGEALLPAERNETGAWLYVELPAQENQTGWIYAALTDIDAARQAARWEEWWQDSNVKWNPPGTYSSTLPGLDYDFELSWRDESEQWDWEFVDPEGCYDALRVYLGDLPARKGLRRAEIVLSDPFVERDVAQHDHRGERSLDAFYPPRGFDREPLFRVWPDWNESNLPHPDFAFVTSNCPNPQPEQVCHLHPMWGNEGTAFLDGAATIAMSSGLGISLFTGATRRWLNSRDAYEHYLNPLDLEDRVPAGSGPCIHLIKSE